jgi:hypothetical protein
MAIHLEQTVWYCVVFMTTTKENKQKKKKNLIKAHDIQNNELQR